jgi:hypothetical protein
MTITTAKQIDGTLPAEVQDWVIALGETSQFDGVFIPDVDGVDEAGIIAEHLRRIELSSPNKRYAVRRVEDGEEAAEGWAAPQSGYLILRVA